mgnify:CR=1 FL=1
MKIMISGRLATPLHIVRGWALGLLFFLPTLATAQHLGALNQVIDLGQVPYNQPITAEFELVNKSDKTISLVKARSSCGCTTVDYPKDPIRKGGEIIVSATYDARQLGHFYKQVALYTDQDDKPLKLTLKGVVVDKVVNYVGKYDYMLGELSADRKTISFEDVNAGDQPTAKIHIMNPTKKAAQPVVMHLPAYLKADVSPSKLAPGQSGTITLTLASEELSDYGLTQTLVYLGMNPGERVSPDKEMKVSAVLLPSFADYTDDDYAYAPKLHLSVGEGAETKLHLGSFNGKKKLKGEVFIINEGLSELEISQLQMFTPGIQLSLDKSHLAPDEITTLHVTAVAKDFLSDGQQPRILLITNDPHRPKVTINIEIE